MNYIVQGVILSVCCIAGYGYAFRCMTKGRESTAITLLMICGLALRLYTASDLFLHAWDERYHALVAKNMLNHFFLPTLYDKPVVPTDYHHWTLGHVWLHKQPLPLWLIAFSLKLFGINELAVRIPSILMTTIGISLVFDIGRHLFNNKVAFLAAFLYSINGMLVEMSAGRIATDHPEIAFTFFVLLGVWCGVKYAQRQQMKYNVLTGFAVGLAILCKWLPALIVLPVWLLLTYERKKKPARLLLNGLLMVAVIALVALPWQLYILHSFPVQAAWEYAFNARHMTEVLDANGGPPWYFFDRLRIDYGELVYLPVLWFTYKTIKVRRPKDIAVSIWFWVPYLFFSLCATKMNGYTLFAAPAVFFMTANAFMTLKEKAPAYRRYNWLAVLTGWLFVLLPVRYTVERVKLFGNAEREPGWTADIKKIRGSAIDNEKTVLFNSSHPIETMFYTKVTAYENTPDADTLERLKRRGYNIIVLQ